MRRVSRGYPYLLIGMLLVLMVLAMIVNDGANGATTKRKALLSTNDWVTAVRVVQRVYPGTRSWLLSCSAAEGGHGPWVWYGGDHWHGYHIGNDTVGGQLQFRWSTFKPYWYGYWGAKGALADTRSRGFIVPNLGSGYGPWLSALGQALTGAYMRYTGRDGHHWSASHGRGC